MNLIIDIGNTRAKLAVFQQDKIIFKISVAHKNLLEKVKKILKTNPLIEFAILSSVDIFTKEEEKELRLLIKLIVLTKDTVIPFQNLYATPTTLGVDRIALIAATAMQYPKENVLVIDSGTCITYDFLNVNNEYLGGAISLGLSSRYEALHNLTANLPLLKPNDPDFFIGNSTQNSIHSGVVNGLLHEIDGVIGDYLLNYSKLTVILTGGDAVFLSKRLKSSIFAKPNFLLEGLNMILEINKDLND